MFYNIIKRNGSSIYARRVTDGREICRDSSFFKLVDAATRQSDQRSGATNKGDFEDRRESAQRRSRVHNADRTDNNIVCREQDNAPAETNVHQQPVPPREDQNPNKPNRRSQIIRQPPVVVVVLVFYVHGKHLRSCRDGQLT